MIDDCLRLTIDEIFPTKYAANCLNDVTGDYCSPFPVNGYSISENLWELLCNIKSQ